MYIYTHTCPEGHSFYNNYWLAKEYEENRIIQITQTQPTKRCLFVFLFRFNHRDLLELWPAQIPLVARYIHFGCQKRKNYGGSEKLLPTLIKEKEPLWYQVP